MTARAFALVLAAVAGTPLLCAALLSLTDNVVAAVVACLALAAGGALGLGVGIALCARAGRELAGKDRP